MGAKTKRGVYAVVHKNTNKIEYVGKSNRSIDDRQLDHQDHGRYHPGIEKLARVHVTGLSWPTTALRWAWACPPCESFRRDDTALPSEEFDLDVTRSDGCDSYPARYGVTVRARDIYSALDFPLAGAQGTRARVEVTALGGCNDGPGGYVPRTEVNVAEITSIDGYCVGLRYPGKLELLVCAINMEPGDTVLRLSVEDELLAVPDFQTDADVLTHRRRRLEPDEAASDGASEQHTVKTLELEPRRGQFVVEGFERDADCGRDEKHRDICRRCHTGSWTFLDIDFDARVKSADSLPTYTNTEWP